MNVEQYPCAKLQGLRSSVKTVSQSENSKSLFTYCDNLSKRPKRNVVLAPRAIFCHGMALGKVSQMACGAGGGNCPTADEH